MKTNKYNQKILSLIILALTLLTPDTHAMETTQPAPSFLTDIALSQKTFCPDKDSAVTIRYKLSRDAKISIKLYNENDVEIRSLITAQSLKTGIHTASWDGRDDQARLVPAGVYIYTLEAQSANSDIIRYDPADETGGLLLKVRKPLIDVKNRKITYIMPRAGRVRIRAGIKNGPHLKTLIDWVPREAGRQEESWDGLDQSGLINLFNIPDRQEHIFAYTLPNNCIIVKRSQTASAEPNIIDETYKRRPQTQVNLNRKYEHARHDLADCHEPDFTLSFPDAQLKDGAPVLSGVAPIKIAISEKDRHQLESARFEVMLYADLRFIFEDEEGFTPFTFLWDTKGLTPGEHILTVNILGYNDHCGVRSRKVLIRSLTPNKP